MVHLVRTATGTAVRSDAVAGVVPVVSPEATLLGVFPAAIRLGAFPVVILLGASPVEVSQAPIRPEALPAVTHLEGSPAVIPLEALRAVAFQVAASQVVMVAEAAMVEGGTVDNSI